MSFERKSTHLVRALRADTEWLGILVEAVSAVTLLTDNLRACARAERKVSRSLSRD